MAAVIKIDANATGLRIAEEATFKVLPGSPVWKPMEPNEYDDFGGSIVITERNPINASRMPQKGVVTDLSATGGFTFDVTQTSLQDLWEGVMFANFRRKGEEVPTGATGTTDLFDLAATAGFLVGSLVRSTGWAETGNNFNEGVVTAVVANTTIALTAETLVTQGSPPSGVNLVVVGHEGVSADIDVVVSGTFPKLVASTLDFTTLGLVVGEWVWIGGDPAASDFVNAENNGFKRIRAISTTDLEFDKSELAMSAETGTSILLRIYFGRVLKNETEASALIVRRSYQLERSLGAPNDSSPSQIQAEYVVGAVPGQASINIPSASKMTANISFIGGDHETIDGPTSLKSGTRPAIVASDAFNTSSDFTRIRLAIHVDGTEAPAALFAFAQNLEITFNENLAPNKAVGTLGAIEISHGTLNIGGSITAYFADVASVNAVRNNSNVTLDFGVVKGATGEKQGFMFDMPLITLGDARLNVVQDQSITLPLEMAAASAVLIDANLDYVAMFSFYDFLPNAADT